MKACLPLALFLSLLLGSGVSPQSSNSANRPVAAAQLAPTLPDTWKCEAEPEAEPLSKNVQKAEVIQFKSWPPSMKTTSHIRDAVDAFSEAFPELLVAPADENRLVLIGNTGKRGRHYLEVAQMAAHLLGTRGLENGYFIGNLLVRLEKGNACQIEKEFNKADAEVTAQNKQPTLKVFGLSEKVLVIVPVLPPPTAAGDFEFPIDLEARAAALKSKLQGKDKELREAADETKLKAKAEDEARRKPRILTLDKQDELDANEVATALKGRIPGYSLTAVNEETFLITPEKPEETAEKKALSGSPAKRADNAPTKSLANLPEPNVVELKGVRSGDVVRFLGNQFPGVRLRKIDDSHLAILSGEIAATPAGGKKDDESAAEDAKKEKKVDEQPVVKAQAAIVRLYHLRDAAAVAKVFESGNDKPVKAIGTDLLLIDADGNPEKIQEIRRVLALLDLPRPQIGLQVWSMQVSSDDTQEAAKRLDDFRHDINLFNQILQGSLESGWERVMRISREPKAMNEDFRNYIAEDFMNCSRKDRYCLGYQDAFLASAPSLTRLLLFLAAFESPLTQVNEAARAMEKLPARISVPEGVELKFTNFEIALSQLLRDEQLASFRTAIADFLFHYKWATEYPSEFIPYDLTLSAHVLDSMLTPIHDAFARDLERLVEQLQKQNSYLELKKLQKKNIKKERTRGFYSSGLIRVTTLSGTEAKSSGQVSNYFDVTPPLSLQDLLKPNDILKTGLPDVLTAKEAMLAGIAANLLAQPRVIAEVGRGMKLTVTPVGLETAASAELQVELESGEDSPPSVYSGPAEKKPVIDRVTKHSVTDRVRVESLKLFEISTFGMDLQYRKDFILPVVGDAWQALFGAVPGMNALFRWPGRSIQNKSNRSIAVVSAVVVPTAMDLAYSIRFQSDRELDSGGAQKIHSTKQLFGDARAFHKLKMRCMRGSSEKPCASDKGEGLRMSDIVGNLRFVQ